MLRKLTMIAIGISALCLVLTGLAPVGHAAMYKFSGGPSGGTFQYYASAISTLSKDIEGLKVLASSSAGSIENIRLVNAGRSNFGLAYAGHVYQSRNGMLKGDDRKYEDVRALGYFYSAPGQMVVRAGSDIMKAKDLAGKRVGVGNAGSGAAANCELFFRELGIWDNVDRNFLGYRAAADAFKNRQLDAFWVFAGFPNASVLEAALQNKVRLLDLWGEAQSIGMIKKYPYFSKVTIPAGTYRGQDEDVTTFQESTLWIANKDVPADVVYELLKKVYSPEGLEYMVSVHKSAKAMSVEGGLQGIMGEDGEMINTLHPGAEKFWKEMGVLK